MNVWTSGHGLSLVALTARLSRLDRWRRSGRASDQRPRLDEFAYRIMTTPHVTHPLLFHAGVDVATRVLDFSFERIHTCTLHRIYSSRRPKKRAKEDVSINQHDDLAADNDPGYYPTRTAQGARRRLVPKAERSPSFLRTSPTTIKIQPSASISSTPKLIHHVSPGDPIRFRNYTHYFIFIDQEASHGSWSWPGLGIPLLILTAGLALWSFWRPESLSSTTVWEPLRARRTKQAFEKEKKKSSPSQRQAVNSISHGVKPFILSYRYVCTELTEVAILFGSLRVWFKSWATGVRNIYTTKYQCIGGAYKRTVSKEKNNDIKL